MMRSTSISSRLRTPILGTLAGGTPKSSAEICATLADYPKPHIAATLRELSEEGSIEGNHRGWRLPKAASRSPWWVGN